MTLLRAFVRNGFCPTIVRNGRKILLMEIKPLSLRFITSNSYFEGNEYDLANQYELIYNKIYFPSKFDAPENWFYDGIVPNVNYFLLPLDNDNEIEAKLIFVSNLNKLKHKWNFQKELIQFSDQKLWLLTLSCLKFLKDSFEFQNDLNQIQNLNQNLFLNPFSFPLCSLSGFVYKLFKLHFLNSHNIYIVENEFGISSKNVSKIEYEWCSFMEYTYPEKEFISAFNNSSGQKYFKEAIPDLYSPISQQAYFFNGCVFHGHFENCLINKNATESSKNPFVKTFKELDTEFFTKMSDLLVNMKLKKS